MDKKTKWLFFVLSIIILGSVAVTTYSTVFEKDFEVFNTEPVEEIEEEPEI